MRNLSLEEQTRLRVLQIQYETLKSVLETSTRRLEQLQEEEKRREVDEIARHKTAEGLKAFCEYYLDITPTPDQMVYEKNAEGKWCTVNRSSNKWGKTFWEACGVIQEAYYKLDIETDDDKAWLQAEYLQAVAAPEYSGSKTLLNEFKKIVEGEIMKPNGHPNASKLKGWFITKAKGLESDSNIPPIIRMYNNSELWGRSYSGLGASMKQKTFYNIVIDESGDIPELHKFIFLTLLPRTAMAKYGRIRIIGTPQGYKYDYSLVIQELERDPNAYVHQGSMKENIYITTESFNRMKEAYKNDPVMMRQVMEGDLIAGGRSVFPGDVVEHMIDLDSPIVRPAYKGHQYIIGIDAAVKTDELVITVFDVTKKPYLIVKQFAIEANFLSPDSFYAEIRSIQKEYNGAFVMFDASGMGGQIMEIQLQAICVNIFFFQIVATKTNPEKGQLNKGDMIVNARDMMLQDRNPVIIHNEDGTIREAYEENPDYGLIRMPNLYALAEQLKVYDYDDKHLQTDKMMSFCLACWGIKLFVSFAAVQCYRRAR